MGQGTRANPCERKNQHCREMKQGEGGRPGAPEWVSQASTVALMLGPRRTRGASPTHACKQCAAGTSKAAETRRHRGFVRRGAEEEPVWPERAREGGGRAQPPAWRMGCCLCWGTHSPSLDHLTLSVPVSRLGSAGSLSPTVTQEARAAASAEARLGQGSPPRPRPGTCSWQHSAGTGGLRTSVSQPGASAGSWHWASWGSSCYLLLLCQRETHTQIHTDTDTEQGPGRKGTQRNHRLS